METSGHKKTLCIRQNCSKMEWVAFSGPMGSEILKNTTSTWEHHLAGMFQEDQRLPWDWVKCSSGPFPTYTSLVSEQVKGEFPLSLVLIKHLTFIWKWCTIMSAIYQSTLFLSTVFILLLINIKSSIWSLPLLTRFT